MDAGFISNAVIQFIPDNKSQQKNPPALRITIYPNSQGVLLPRFQFYLLC